jgi:hypothetical protein
MAILIVLKDFFAATAPVHDMVDGGRILKAEFAGHGAGSARIG